VIISRVEKMQGSSLDDVLTADERAQAHFIVSTCEDKLYFAMLYLAWQCNENWPSTRAEYFSEVPWGLRKIISGKARKGIIKALHGQGIGRRPLEQVVDLSKQVIDDLSHVLGDKSTLFGTPKLTTADIVVYANLDRFLYAEFPHNPIRDYIKTKATLVKFVDDVTMLYFPEVNTNRQERKMLM